MTHTHTEYYFRRIDFDTQDHVVPERSRSVFRASVWKQRPTRVAGARARDARRDGPRSTRCVACHYTRWTIALKSVTHPH
eukprot:1692449-Prymnesium_polylepis.2